MSKTRSESIYISEKFLDSNSVKGFSNDDLKQCVARFPIHPLPQHNDPRLPLQCSRESSQKGAQTTKTSHFYQFSERIKTEIAKTLLHKSKEIRASRLIMCSSLEGGRWQ
jgi:hypothetical protein